MKIKIYRLPKVIKRTGIKRSHIYKLMQEGKFPKQIHLTERAVGWTKESIDDWCQEKIQASHTA